MAKLDKALQQQIDLNKTKNILYTQLGEIMEIDPDFLAALEELSASDQKAFSERELQNAVAFASDMLLKRLYSINQFLQIDEQKKHSLEDIYLRTWRRIVETKDIQSALQEYHYPALKNWIASLYPRSFLKQLRELPMIGHVVCEEYSPSLQIDLLRLDVQTLKQPVLDIGCGSTAGLTRHLRALGIEAYGIDRHIEKEETYLQDINWMDYKLEPATWGTIVSNMAFTNHLLYAKHYDQAQLARYLLKFKEVIEALIVDGCFHYAPSLPFLEEILDASLYRIERFNVFREIYMTRIMKLAK